MIDCTYIEATGHGEASNLAVDEAGADAEVHYSGPWKD
jgi:hypothetical protein